VAQARQREADYVVVAAFDARDVASGAALDGVGAGFVEGFFRSEVLSEVFRRKRGEMDVGGFDEGAALGVGKADDSDAGYDGMDVAGKPGQHLTGVVGRARLAEYFSVDEDSGVGSNDDGRAYSACGDELGLGVGKALHQVLSRFAWDGGFVYGRRQNREVQTGVAEDLRAARGGRSEDEFGRGHAAARILHARPGNSLCVWPDATLLGVPARQQIERHRDSRGRAWAPR
jgi:hypothetical protein